MRRGLLILVGLMTLAVPAAPADNRPKVSLGYSFVTYLEEGGGSAPLGAFLSIAGSRNTTLELDLGYQRDSEEGIVLNTLTATAGPRITFGTRGKPTPFIHVLGGVRHDRVEGESNTAFGGMAGAGVDVKSGQGVALRLGADFQIFFDEGENLKTLRLGIGVTF